MRKGSHSFIYYLTAQIISFYRLNCDFLMSPECARSLENIKYIAKKDKSIFLTFHSKFIDVLYYKQHYVINFFKNQLFHSKK